MPDSNSMIPARRSGRAAVRPLVILAAAVLVLAAFATSLMDSSATASDDDASRPHIAVMGDSITSSYIDVFGSERQGWWSMLGQRLQMRVSTSAEDGSGFVRHGLDCGGTRFFDRRHNLLGANVIIIEGGRNDWLRCGGGEPVTHADVRTAVREFLGWIAAQEIPRQNVYVLTPWGTLDRDAGIAMTRIIEPETRLRGFHFIDTWGALSAPERTHDGVHPTLAGSRALYETVLQNSDLGARFG